MQRYVFNFWTAIGLVFFFAIFLLLSQDTHGLVTIPIPEEFVFTGLFMLAFFVIAYRFKTKNWGKKKTWTLARVIFGITSAVIGMLMWFFLPDLHLTFAVTGESATLFQAYLLFFVIMLAASPVAIP